MADAPVDTSGNGLSGVLPDETPIQDDTEDVIDEVEEVGGEPVPKPSEETQEQADTEEKPAQDAEPDKKPATEDKFQKAYRELQGKYDTLVSRVSPHAQRLAEWEAEQAKKQAEIVGNRDKALSELAEKPIETMRLAARMELQEYLQQQEAQKAQVEWQKAGAELSNYALERGVDQEQLAQMLQPFNGFAGMPPNEALGLAKMLVDKHLEPQTAKERTATALKEADKLAKEKLTKKTPAGTPGGSAASPVETAEQKFWTDIQALSAKKTIKAFG